MSSKKTMKKMQQLTFQKHKSDIKSNKFIFKKNKTFKKKNK